MKKVQFYVSNLDTPVTEVRSKITDDIHEKEDVVSADMEAEKVVHY